MLPVRLLVVSCRYREFFVAEGRPVPSAPKSVRIFLRQERNQGWLLEVSLVPATLRNRRARLPLFGWLPEMQRGAARLSARSQRQRDLSSGNRRNLWRFGLQ